HTESVEKYGVFGTPTFLFESGNTVYLKTFIPPEEDSVAFFEHFIALMSHRSWVGELKRPQPPWPKGALS
ncbi:MAG: DsbA family selenoprotein, partial [Dehalococcoidia bacterium]